jgi:RNA polymerase sigma factor (sigma-70 family)
VHASPPNRSSFSELLSRFREGDSVATEELLRRYTPVLREVVRKRLPQRMRGEFESLDFVQEVWTGICSNRARPPVIDTPDQLQAYLVATAVHRVVDALRHRTAQQSFTGIAEQSLTVAIVGSEPTPSQWVMADERWDSIASSLPEAHVRVVECVRQGYTQQEIATMTGISVRVISRIVQHVRRKCEEAPV